METSELLNIILDLEKMKHILRHSYTSEGRRESVAEHSWRMSLMALLLADEFEGVDMSKVVRMCLLHDLGEMFIGDIPSFNKTECDTKKEREKLMLWIDSLGEEYRTKMQAEISEFFEGSSEEAKICSALDKLETVIQHNEADIETWCEEEYKLLLEHGDEDVGFSTFLVGLREELKKETERKIANRLCRCKKKEEYTMEESKKIEMREDMKLLKELLDRMSHNYTCSDDEYINEMFYEGMFKARMFYSCLENIYGKIEE